MPADTNALEIESAEDAAVELEAIALEVVLGAEAVIAPVPAAAKLLLDDVLVKG